MSRAPFYHSSTKKIVVAFATIFDDIKIHNDYGEEIKVPLHFAQKEKFIDDLQSGVQYDMDDVVFDIVFPKMGFELTGINYAPERHLNPLHQMVVKDETTGGEMLTYNRIPYDITFDLYVGAHRLEDSLKVVEQIIPFFTPELTVQIHDRADLKLKTNIPIVLNSVAVNVDYQGSLDSSRTIIWTLNFTAKSYYYPDVRKTAQIKQTIMNLNDFDFEERFLRLTSTVVPMNADRDDPHTIIDEAEE